MENLIPIFYACDDNFVKYTLVSMKSIMENASKDYKYIIYILNTSIENNTKENVLKMKNEYFDIEFIDCSSYIDSIKDNIPLRDYYSKTTYFRLFIAEMFPNIDKAIYIDSDTIVLGDVSKLYNHDLKDNLVGACNEQAMVQNDVYGTYVEKCIGLDRYNYFNAGMLLINCKLFREEKILTQFFEKLSVYNFVVTQDEDYLNLICYNRVLWIDNSWNVEVFGDIKYSDDEINMIHYIMWAKPWHFTNVRLEKHFWKYAKLTHYYQDIIDTLNNYPEEKRESDLLACEALEKLAIKETYREDNYLNRVANSNKIIQRKKYSRDYE